MTARVTTARVTTVVALNITTHKFGNGSTDYRLPQSLL